jgi:putative transposase
MASASLGPALTTEAPRSPNHELGHSRPRQHHDGRESLWGAPRIHGELTKLGITISERTVSRMLRRRRPPSQSWRTFLTNHVGTLVSLDFFTVSTLTGRVLFVLVLLAHQRRRIIHLNVTEHPTAMWTAQQMIEAFPDDTAPRWLLRDRDAIYGDLFRHRVASMGIGEVISSPSSPWQNPYAERVIGSIRRECLDHMIVLGERHLRRVLARYLSYYHGARTHLSLEKDSPTPRRIQAPTEGRVVAFAEVGGLHHRYERRAVGRREHAIPIASWSAEFLTSLPFDQTDDDPFRARPVDWTATRRNDCRDRRRYRDSRQRGRC